MFFFDTLMASDDNLCSPHLFDAFRDEMRDCLTADNPALFPCFGACMTSVSAILEYFFPACERQMLCVGPSGEHSVLNEHFPCLCIPTHDIRPGQPSATALQCWLDDWIWSLTARICVRSPHVPSVPESRVVLVGPPPILFFEVASLPVISLIPVWRLVIACEQGSANYLLRGIVYFGNQHFSTRLFTDDDILDYDGQQNQGKPQRAVGMSTRDVYLRLDDPQGRRPHIYVY